MIGSMRLTTCNCSTTDRIVPPELSSVEVNLTLQASKVLNTGSQAKIAELNIKSGPYCPIRNGTFSKYCSGLGCSNQGDPYWYLNDRVTVADDANIKVRWFDFLPSTFSTGGGVYYRPGTATQSGGTVLATGLAGKRNVYSALTFGSQITGTFSWARHGTFSEGFPYGYQTYNGCCEPDPTDPVLVQGPEKLAFEVVETIAGNIEAQPDKSGIGPFFVRWLVASEELDGLTVTLTAAGAGLGQWLVTKSDFGIELRCSTTTHTISNSISLTNARTQINATGHFSASINSKVNTTNAKVSDLQPKSRFVSGTGGCVKLIIVPANSVLAPSNSCGFYTGDGLGLSVFTFQKNQGFVDDEGGLRRWFSQVLGLKYGNTGPFSQDATADQSPATSRWFVYANPRKPDGSNTGWEFNPITSGPVVKQNALCTVTLGYLISSNTWSHVGCTPPSPGAFRFECGFNPCNASCGPCSQGPCDPDDPESGETECPQYVACEGCYSNFDPDYYPSECFAATTSLTGTCKISLGS